MGLFCEVMGEVAIIVQGGRYQQVPVYTRDGYLYAKNGSGFIRLHSDGSTTLPKARLDQLTYDHPLGVDQLGRLCDLATVPGSKPLPQEKTQLLLGLLKD
jgi:hypothetical protein